MNPYLHGRFIVTLLAAASCFLPQLAGIARAQTTHAASRDPLWQRVDKIPAAPANARIGIRPTKFQTFTTNAALLRSALAQAPQEFAARPPAAGSEMTLPKPDGTMARFQIEEVALMEPALAARYPGIKTYRGRGIDDPMASLHLDINPLTFRQPTPPPLPTP
ncbi:MAG: hypothetical protein LC642_05775 [Verrucomicrobiaceae bacterium]|nr:hypothetical protein [Verrucomicrobiaceae bacterium]